MKKVLSLNALLAGIIVFLFSLVMPLEQAIQFSMSLSILADPRKVFVNYWTKDYVGLTVLGILLVVVGIVLLVRLHGVSGRIDPYSPVLISSGCSLGVLSLLELTYRCSDLFQAFSEYSINRFLSSSFGDSLGVSLILYLFYGCIFWVGLLVLGITVIIAGIVVYRRERRLEKRQAAEAEEVHAAEPEPEAVGEIAQVPAQEEEMTLYCTVVDIRGDYALVKYDNTGIESEVALALLPLGIDVGDKLKFENYEFTQI